jgi:hypothetical protein
MLQFSPNPVVDSVPEALLAPKVALGRLDGHMPEEELNLFKFATCLVAKTGACPT